MTFASYKLQLLFVYLPDPLRLVKTGSNRAGFLLK